ncbi:MAG: plastocyanin/azurin family copper-binding protein [Candidatus Limnocylindrales bacterium]
MESQDEHDFQFGEPADAAQADRVIEIVGADDFSWDPATVAVKVGETITFRVTNAGVIPHDFTLGDAATQDEHEMEMAGGGMGILDEPNAFVLDAGATKETTWTFTEAGEVLFGCHQSGHYAAGMVGSITVTE